MVMVQGVVVLGIGPAVGVHALDRYVRQGEGLHEWVVGILQGRCSSCWFTWRLRCPEDGTTTRWLIDQHRHFLRRPGGESDPLESRKA